MLCMVHPKKSKFLKNSCYPGLKPCHHFTLCAAELVSIFPHCVLSWCQCFHKKTKEIQRFSKETAFRKCLKKYRNTLTPTQCAKWKH